MYTASSLAKLAYQPRFPEGASPGIGIIGCGSIVRLSHAPAYKKYGLNVLGLYDLVPEAARSVQEVLGGGHIYENVEELLASPEISVVDIATHPGPRAALIRQALEAGKHVLSQKPLALDMRIARELVELAEARNLKLAVNQNGRWSPPWRVATLLVEQGAVGEVLSVTHLFETSFEWIIGLPFDTIPHFAIYDYAVHWFDITRCWLAETPVKDIRAHEFRMPNQPPTSQKDWGTVIEISYINGASALIRGVSGTKTKQAGHPFWIHGTEGTLRGNVLSSQDFVELERDSVFSRPHLEGKWFPDGMAGTMGELLCAIAEQREPYNAARHNLLSLQMTLAACLSADRDGRPVTLEEVL